MSKQSIMKISKDPSGTPITQADIDSGKLKLVKRDASGALVKPKQRINIFLDSDTVQYFKSKAGERGYQTLINETLKQAIQADSLENIVRKAIREELSKPHV